MDSRRPQWFPAAHHLADDSTRKHSNHRWEDGAVGALGLGTLSLALAAGLCNSDSGANSCTGPVIGSFLAGALVGGVTGLLIGSSIPKEDSDSLPGEVTKEISDIPQPARVSVPVTGTTIARVSRAHGAVLVSVLGERERHNRVSISHGAVRVRSIPEGTPPPR